MRTVLITGGAKGLGAHLARHLGARGHRVVVWDRTPADAVNPAVREAVHRYVRMDLSDRRTVERAIAHLVTEDDVDVLINNAGARSFDDFWELSEREIDETIEVNLQVPLRLTRALLPGMQARGYGRIINVSSCSAFRAYPSGTLYCSTKNALVVFTEALAADLATADQNVTANAICPDSFRTREGEELPQFSAMMNTIAATVDSLLATARNGEVIPIASRRRIAADALLSLRKHVRRLF